MQPASANRASEQRTLATRITNAIRVRLRLARLLLLGQIQFNLTFVKFLPEQRQLRAQFNLQSTIRAQPSTNGQSASAENDQSRQLSLAQFTPALRPL